MSIKAQFILEENLAGIMFWSIDTDDFHGECFSEAYPLLATANRALGNPIPERTTINNSNENN